MINYIPETDEKYSITEEGVVTMHYKISSSMNKIKCNKVMTTFIKKNKSVLKIRFLNKPLASKSIESLVHMTYGFTKCKHCNSKINGKMKDRRCYNCTLSYDKLASRKARENIVPFYIAQLSGLKRKEVTNEFHEVYKSKIEIIRLIKQKSNEIKAL